MSSLHYSESSKYTNRSIPSAGLHATTRSAHPQYAAGMVHLCNTDAAIKHWNCASLSGEFWFWSSQCFA